jgi:DNA-directed RNA polymerase I subunit RPA43
VARILGQRWSSMSDDAKQPYHEKAALERERVATATEAWKKAAIAAGLNIDGKTIYNTNDTQRTESNNGQFILPVGRVRKICRLDPDVRGVSKEAVLLITKATEMVTILLGQECIKTAHIQNRRTLLPQDIVDVCQVREPFYFLKDDITDLHRQQQKSKQVEKSNGTSNGKLSQQHQQRTSATTTTTAVTSKPLTDYFKPVA